MTLSAGLLPVGERPAAEDVAARERWPCAVVAAADAPDCACPFPLPFRRLVLAVADDGREVRGGDDMVDSAGAGKEAK